MILLYFALLATLLGCMEQEPEVLNSRRGNSLLQGLAKIGHVPQHRSAVLRSMGANSFDLTQGHMGAEVKYHSTTGYAAVIQLAYDIEQSGVARAEVIKAAKLGWQSFDSILGVPLEQLMQEPQVVVLSEDLLVVVFQQHYQGLMVRDASARVFLRDGQQGWQVVKILNQTYGPVTDVLADEGLGQSSADVAAQLGLESSEVTYGEQGLIARSAFSGQGYDYVTVQDFLVSGNDADGGYFITSDTNAGEVIQVSPLHKQFYLKGRVSEHAHAGTDEQVLALSDLTGDVHTDGRGEIQSGSAQSFDLVGRHAVVLDSTGLSINNLPQGRGSGLSPVQLTAKQQGDDTWLATPRESHQSAIDTYVAVGRITKTLEKYLSPDALPNNLQVPVHINLSGSECNASFNGSAINFFSGERRCRNSGSIDTVVFHEWGHWLDNQLGTRNSRLPGYPGGITDGAFSEGIGDIAAYLMSGDSLVGKGMYHSGRSGVRDLNNKSHESQVPSQCRRGIKICEVHERGQIIGGAFYQLDQALQNRYGERTGRSMSLSLFFNHLIITDSYTDSYESVQTLSGQGQRSSDHCLIQEAFKRHGLGDQGQCQDENFVKMDSSVNIAIHSLEGSNAVLQASAVDADKIAICFGEKYKCLKTQQQDLGFELLESRDGRNFFQASQAMVLKDASVLTILSYNQNKLIAARAVELTASAQP